jgi:hypothetical protein
MPSPNHNHHVSWHCVTKTNNSQDFLCLEHPERVMYLDPLEKEDAGNAQLNFLMSDVLSWCVRFMVTFLSDIRHL